MHNNTTDLTKARIDAIHQFYEPGMSARLIADRLAAIEGQPVSRNTVIGIYKRNADYMKDVPLLPPGVNLHRPPPKPRGPYNVKPRAPKPEPREKPTPTPKSNVVPFVLPESMFTYAPTHPTKRMLDLEAHECRWAMSGAGFDIQFCAQHAEGSYCEHHRRMSIGPGTKSERLAARGARKMA